MTRRRQVSQTVLFCLLQELLCSCIATYLPNGRAVNLDTVKTLTLYKGKETSYRRVQGIPQLKCIGGCDYEPDVVQCMNMGSNGRDVQWRCEADLPYDLRFGSTEVVCEGYESPGDVRVLENSCGLEYTLKQLERPRYGSKWQNFKGERLTKKSQGKKWEWGPLLMLALALYIGYSLFKTYLSPAAPNPRQTPGYWGGGGGGGGGFGPSAPPPPPGMFPGNNGGSKYGSASPASSSYGVGGFPANRGGGPIGTWGAAATSLGLGYLLGRGTAPRGGAGAQTYSPWGQTWGSRSRSRGSSSYSVPSSGDSESEESRRATAYASTRRR